MRKLILIALATLGLTATSQSIAQSRYARLSVGFYNLENLFDTEDGDNNDEDFLPNGINAWTDERYLLKLDNMATAISQIAGGKAPDILGLCELENKRVIEDLIAHPKLATYGYSIVHYESPDRRGIDVALIYRPQIFKYQSSNSHRIKIKGEPNLRTRDILEVNGTIMGEPVSLLVAHWPSRAGGEQVSLPRRIAAGQLMRQVSDSIQALGGDQKIIIMGDLNDDPTSPSLTEGLGAVNNPEGLKSTDLFNVMAKLHRTGYGTLAYRDVWNLFDNIIVSGNMIDSDTSKLTVLEDRSTKAYGRIFNASFLTQQTGHYKGYPMRTFSNGAFNNGYSDHYPVFIYLIKELKK